MVKYDFKKIKYICLSLCMFVSAYSNGVPLPQAEYACVIATYGDYVLSSDPFQRANTYSNILDINYTKPIEVNLKSANFERVPCGDQTFKNVYNRTQFNAILGTVNIGNTPISSQGSSLGQFAGFQYILGWTALVIAPGDDISICLDKNSSGSVSYVSCSKGTKTLDNVSVQVNSSDTTFNAMLSRKKLNFTLPGSNGQANESYGCKSNRDGVFLEVNCDSPIATHMYSFSNPYVCRQLISPLAVENNATALNFNNNVRCDTDPGKMYSCRDDNGRKINCHDAARIYWAEGREPSFEVVEAPPANMCPNNDPNCLSAGRNNRVVPYANQGTMALHSKTYRNQAVDAIPATNAADAVLAQTSYMARVMMQANDIFPPSHVSTRSSGEIYASTVNPIDYNLKALTQVSVYRNSLGATVTSLQKANPSSTAANSVSTIARDWVEFHLNKYCDPLAGSIGPQGLNNCNAALNSLNATEISQGMAQGKTSWDLVTAKGRTAPYAADISANILFNAKTADPEAGMRYIYNLTNVNPTPLTPKATEFSIPNDMLTVHNGKTTLKDQGYNIYMSYLEEQSKLSLSQYALMKIFADRMQLDTIKIPVTKWDKDGRKTEEFEFSSRHGLLEFETNKRFKDPGWYDRVQQMPVPALLKELAYIQSMQLALDFKRYEQEQLQTAMMATITSDMAKITKLLKQAQEQTPAQSMNNIQSIINGINVPGS